MGEALVNGVSLSCREFQLGESLSLIGLLSLASVLLTLSDNAALACRASMQMTGKPPKTGGSRQPPRLPSLKSP